MMTPMQKAEFTASHIDLDYYDVDLALYKKIYKNSKIIKHLESCEPFEKKGLQERMILEILDCDCEADKLIMSNRKSVMKESTTTDAKSVVYDQKSLMKHKRDDLIKIAADHKAKHKPDAVKKDIITAILKAVSSAATTGDKPGNTSDKKQTKKKDVADDTPDTNAESNKPGSKSDAGESPADGGSHNEDDKADTDEDKKKEHQG